MSDRLAQARLRLSDALLAGESTEAHRQAIAMLQAAQKTAVEPSAPVDDERAARIAKRARQIAKQAMRDVQAHLTAIPAMPELP